MKNIYLPNSILAVPVLFSYEKEYLPKQTSIHIVAKEYTIPALLQETVCIGGILSKEQGLPDSSLTYALDITITKAKVAFSFVSPNYVFYELELVQQLIQALQKALKEIQGLQVSKLELFLKKWYDTFGLQVGLQDTEPFVREKFRTKAISLAKQKKLAKAKSENFTQSNNLHSLQLFNNLFYNSSDPLMIIRRDSCQILECNHKFSQEVGFYREEIIHQELTSFLIGIKTSQQLTELFSNIDGYISNLEIKRKEGVILEIDLNYYPEIFQDQEVYIVQVINNTEQKETNRLKHQFISNISHELRTPMTNIKGFLELITKDSTLQFSNNHREMLDTIFKNIRRMTDLINNLLEIEKKSDGEKNNKIEFFNPALVIEEIISTNKQAAVQKGLVVNTEPPLEQNLVMEGNKLDFSKIIANIFTNAIKYTFKGYIKVSLQKEVNNLCLIIIEDSGIGIDPKYSVEIFERFFRVPDKANRKIGGSGIGLSIAYETTTIMGGEILFEKTSSKGGTRFLIYLPAKLKTDPNKS